jgi:DNA repair exonuclease SbcCD ATPase subunit
MTGRPLIQDDETIPTLTADESHHHTDRVKHILEEIETTTSFRDELKQKIDTIIDSITQNRSLFSRAATFWGNLALWQKIGLGFLLIAPTLILGIVVHLSLIALSVLTLVVYVTFSFIFDNHHERDDHINDCLKETMVHMADSLDSMINSLASLRHELAKEIEHFQQENKRLTLNISALTNEIEALTEQIDNLISTEQKLKAVQLDLNQTNRELYLSVEEHSRLLLINRTELDQITKAIEQTHLDLSEKIAELKQVKKDLGLEIVKAKEASSILYDGVMRLSEAVLVNEQHRDLFQEKLNEFISDNGKSFDEVALRIREAEQELSRVKEELNQSNKRYHMLLEREELIIRQLEDTTRSTPHMSASSQGKSTLALKKIGLYSENKTSMTELANKDAAVCSKAI